MLRAVTFALLTALLGCEGAIGGTGDPPPPVDPPISLTPGGDPPEVACAELPVGAPIPLRRLTAAQLEATVIDVLGATIAYDTSDETLTGYRANTTTAVQDEAANSFMQAAETVAEQIAPRLVSACVGPCGDFILDTIAPRLFRRPLNAEVRARYMAIYVAGEVEGGAEEGVRWLVGALLQSPRFLYLIEEPGPDGMLDGYAMAARLSYSLWGTAPDAALLAEAESGALSTVDGVRSAASRLIDDDRFEEGARQFVLQWLHLETLEDISKRADFFALPEALRDSLLEEPTAHFVHHVRAGSGVIALLESPITPADAALDDYYASESQRIEDGLRHLDPARRAGLLTLPGVQAALSHAEATSPTVRGFTILDRFFCARPPPPPAGVTPSLPPDSGELTTRERLSAHFDNDTCGGCHRQMDGIGFSFENYDWLGRWRNDEHDVPIDATANFTIGGHVIDVDGPIEMSGAIAGRWDVDLCVARQWTVYASSISAASDASCLLEAMGLASRASGLREMLLVFVSSEWFRRPYVEGDGS